MRNERGAGRKPNISSELFAEIQKRYEDGESLASLAKEFGISRQALSQRMKRSKTNEVFTIDYYADGELATLIEVDVCREKIHLINYASKLSQTAFGFDESPDWEDFQLFLEREYLKVCGIDTNAVQRAYLCMDESVDSFKVDERLPVFEFTKKDILYTRTDTDGFQMKALSKDRRFFIKSQAIIGGVFMKDPVVEAIASDICEKLAIPHVRQQLCSIVYAGREYMGVCSANFELDGLTFVSFESLINKKGYSTKDQEFVHLDAVSKLKWCGQRLSEISGIEYEKTLKYMLDLAVIDCLVGNVDRHTRNFGLFYNCYSGAYEIPLIFDNGMGLFEHDRYRDEYKDIEEAMRTVYVSPYGEDPFEFSKMLFEEFDINNLYPGITDLKAAEYKDMLVLLTPQAGEYLERMINLWQNSVL